MTTEYKKKRPICRTFFRPVLAKLPWGFVDRQALPPFRWCQRCGGEVYRVDSLLCRHCKEDKERLEERI